MNNKVACVKRGNPWIIHIILFLLDFFEESITRSISFHHSIKGVWDYIQQQSRYSMIPSKNCLKASFLTEGKRQEKS